jgi:hypothetical protein
MGQSRAGREISLSSSTNFETILTIRSVRAPSNTFELKFDTLFLNAKDPKARQRKASFFVQKAQLKELNSHITQLLSQDKKNDAAR